MGLLPLGVKYFDGISNGSALKKLTLVSDFPVGMIPGALTVPLAIEEVTPIMFFLVGSPAPVKLSKHCACWQEGV